MHHKASPLPYVAMHNKTVTALWKTKPLQHFTKLCQCFTIQC